MPLPDFEPVEARSAEVEPLPPAHEEDENEEVGRPEGPRGVRRVESYDWESQAGPVVSAPPPAIPTAIARSAPAPLRESREAIALPDPYRAVEPDAEPAGTSPARDEDEPGFADEPFGGEAEAGRMGYIQRFPLPVGAIE